MFKTTKPCKQKIVRFYEDDIDLLKFVEGKDFNKYVKDLIFREFARSHRNTTDWNIDNDSISDNDNSIDNDNDSSITKDDLSVNEQVIPVKKRRINRNSLLGG